MVNGRPAIYWLFICAFLLTQSLTGATTGATSNKDAPVEIYYGYNCSHGSNWAQSTADGLVGISYFLPTPYRSDEKARPGNLIYRSVEPNGVLNEEIVATGSKMELSVLLFDVESAPHIFVATSNDTNQTITHYYKDGVAWSHDLVMDFYNQGGKFIYEMSADTGPDGSQHLLVLKTPTDTDTSNYLWAFEDAHLYHLTNSSGTWEKQLIRYFDTFYTMDEYSKASCRQDIEIDSEGYVHVVYGLQINGTSVQSPTCLVYSTNRHGGWPQETAVNYQGLTRDSAGWYPSLSLDQADVPHVSCVYVDRYPTGSAISAHLQMYSRIGVNNWTYQTIATTDDGYFGTDGRRYTGGLTHLKFDWDNKPHIVFTDIASSHAGRNYLNLGNIRHAVLEDGCWNITKVYSQSRPFGFTDATEMFGLCLLVSDNLHKVEVVGEQMVISGANYSSSLIHKTISHTSAVPKDIQKPFLLQQNVPNPFNPSTTINYSTSDSGQITIDIFTIDGHRVKSLVNERKTAGSYTFTWDGTNSMGQRVGSGTYLYVVALNGHREARKMILLK